MAKTMKVVHYSKEWGKDSNLGPVTVKDDYIFLRWSLHLIQFSPFAYTNHTDANYLLLKTRLAGEESRGSLIYKHSSRKGTRLGPFPHTVSLYLRQGGASRGHPGS